MRVGRIEEEYEWERTGAVLSDEQESYAGQTSGLNISRTPESIQIKCSCFKKQNKNRQMKSMRIKRHKSKVRHKDFPESSTF